MKNITIVFFIFCIANLQGQQGVNGELIFPLQEKHVHSSSIIELPGGDLLTCWFEGSGERTANDVVINGSRMKKGETKWSKPFLMADTPGQPDCNPMLFLNSSGKLFLVWIAVQANRWETSILKVKTTTDYTNDGAPRWEWQDVILMKPGVEFEERVREQFEKHAREDLAWAGYALPYEEMLVEAAKDPRKRETGWMTRTHPTVLENGHILLPLYSDGFNFGLIAISEDDGETWRSSLPIVGRGLNQPSLVVRNDGSVDAYMRDDGDEPGRILISHSDDGGYSWSFAQKSDIPNPGASVEVIKLKSGHWLLVYNDVDDGRYSLAVAISDDQGNSWKWKRKLENLKGGSFSYPSVIQAQDGRIHITYSYHLSGERRSIKHMAIEETWIMDHCFPEPKNGNTYVIAHRGVHNGIPENSLAAYQKAIDLGCDFIEIDVRKTRDGRIVSIHNSTIDAYVSGATGKVSDFTLAELKELDIGERVGPEWVGTRIPVIEEIFQLCKGQIGIYLDLKEDLVEELVEIITEYEMERDVVWYIPATHMDAVKSVKSHCFQCLPMPDPGPAANITKVVKQVQPRVIATDMDNLSEGYMKIARGYDTKVFVDEDKGNEKEWARILEWGTDGIQTDHPRALIRFLWEREKEIALRLEPQQGNPRNSEGDFIKLRDGRILFIYTHFTDGSSDHAGAHLAGRYSNDGGKTWTGEDELILPNEGGMNVMSVSLLRLSNGEVALFYLRKNSGSDCIPFMRISTDEAKTWSEPIRCIDADGYHVVNNDRIVQLQSGRIIIPAALHKTVDSEWQSAGQIFCVYSDDHGKSWNRSQHAANPENVVLQEPGIVELKNGQIMMFCRTDAGVQYFSFSKDHGRTWSLVIPGNIKSPRSPASIERIPATGDLLLVWNNNYKPVGDGQKRTPFNLAISKDDGKTWQGTKTIEGDPAGWYCYTAIEFVDNHVLLGHCAGDTRRTGGLDITHITRLSLNWIYRDATSSRDLPDRGICAHRGAMDTHPENTLAAFREAVRLGAHMIELDVRMTKDGHLVILHDEKVDRTTDGSGKISELTLDQVKNLDAGSWKSELFAGETVPTLKEALAVMPENIWLNVHIKGGEKLGEKVARIIVEENRVHQAFLACGTDAARGAKEINREILICNMERQNDREEYIQETIRQQSPFIQLLGSRTGPQLDAEIATLKQHQIRINYCCTDAEDEVKALFASGVDFILTDKLSEMLEVAASEGIEPLQYCDKNSEQ